jgi:hypothetical protein
MFRFRKKRGEEEEKPKEEEKSKKKGALSRFGGGKSMIRTVKAGLNSKWFRPTRFSILKEFEGQQSQTRGVIDDSSMQRAISSVLGSLQGAIEAFTAEDNKEGLKEAADLCIDAYTKIGNPELLDTYMEVCEKAGISEDESKQKLIDAADKSRQIDIMVTLYHKAGDKGKLKGAGDRALNLYLETNELDMKSCARLFDYVVEAYKSADDMEALIDAGDKALRNQVDRRRLGRGKEWVFDAQKAYEAADAAERLAELGNQYMNLYLKEGLESWIDKAIVVYEQGGVDFVAKLNNLADRLEEKGRAGMADTMRRKTESS